MYIKRKRNKNLMKLNKKSAKTSKSKVVIISLVFLILLLSVGTVYALQRGGIFSTLDNQDTEPENSREVNLDPPTTEQQDAGNKAKEDFLNDENPSTTSPISISITSSQVSSDVYQIRTMLSTNEPGGECVLSITNQAGQSISRNVGVQSMGSYTVCQGFDLPINDLQGDTWNGSVTYTVNSNSTRTNITIDM
jgi:cytoskeletal protein RodZ